MSALFGWLGSVWTVMRSPATSLSLGFLTLGGFACGLVFWGAFNTALEFANTETFCLSCHEMRSNACHVSQTDAQPLVRNTFRDALAR